jgi:hypothetical protein
VDIWSSYSVRRTFYLVLIILRKASRDARRVTMCGRPVYASVTVTTGHENERNPSKDENR